MKLVLVDDWSMIRDLLRIQCELHLRDICEIAGEAADGEEAVACILNVKPDCVVLDLELPGMNGFEVITAVRRKLPTVRFLVLTSHCTPWAVSLVRRLGISGFIDKQTAMLLEVLTQALRTIEAGGSYFTAKYWAMVKQLQDGVCPIQRCLSPREIEMLACLSKAQSNEEIADQLGVAAMTVKTHRGRILRKLDLPNTSHLVDFAHATGFAPLAVPRSVLKSLPDCSQAV